MLPFTIDLHTARVRTKVISSGMETRGFLVGGHGRSWDASGQTELHMEQIEHPHGAEV
jgi:hypothetical protein